MIPRKKIFLGAALLWLTALLLPILASVPHASAATSPPKVTVGSDFKFTSAADITGTINGSQVTFHDSNIKDSSSGNTNPNYQPQDIDKGTFCDPGGGWGVNLTKNYDPTAKTITGTIRLGYQKVLGNNTKCTAIPSGSFQPSDQVQIDNSSGYAGASYIWKDAKTIETGDGQQNWSLAAGTTDTFIQPASSPSFCEAASVIITSGPNSGTLYLLTSTGDPSQSVKDPVKRVLKNPERCFLTSSFQLNGGKNPQQITITGSPSNPPGGGGTCDDGSTPDASGKCADGSAPTTTGDQGSGSCESSSNIGLEWVVCPLIRFIDGMVKTFYGYVQGQLCFQAGPSTTAGGVTCDGNLLTDQVEKAWSMFRIIASSLLVIVMLVMVISQALGMEFFSAYTVRKLLPKLVAATILIQISWFLAKFAIDISNDLGQGISAIMYAPFGGQDTVSNIDTALKNVGSTGTLAAGSIFAALVVATIFTGLSIGGVLLLALTGIAAAFIGFIVLFIRKILILFCVILIPIAILAWLLPGTDRFWKLWRETFTKLLLMFPMITGLIAAGQIFGRVAGGTSHNITALFAVLIGFFGPLFLLPKTYQWGGSALGSLGGALVNSTKGLRRKPMEYAMNQGKINRERRSQDRAFRLATTEPGNRRLRDRLLAGEFNVARSRSAREREFQKTLATGDKEARENVGAQLLGIGFSRMRHGPVTREDGSRAVEGDEDYENNKLDALQAWLEGREYAGVTPDEALMGHSFDELARLGDPDRIRAARRNSRAPEAVWSEAIARNFGRMNEIARDFTLAPDLSTLSTRQFATQDADTARELVRQLDGEYVMDRQTGHQRTLTEAEARDQQVRATRLAEEFERNPLLMADLGNDHRQVIEQLLQRRNPTEVRAQTDTRTRQTTVAMPEGSVISPTISPTATTEERDEIVAASRQARANVTRALVDPSMGQAAAQAFAVSLSNPEDRPAYDGMLADFHTQALGGSSEAARIVGNLERAYSSHQDASITQMEQEMVGQNQDPTHIQQTVAAARQQANQELQSRFPTLPTP